MGHLFVTEEEKVIPWTEEPGGLYSPQVHKDCDMSSRLNNNSKKEEGQALLNSLLLFVNVLILLIS